MLTRPRLKGHFTVFPRGRGRWRVSGGLDELTRFDLRNEQAIEAFARLLPLLDGRDATGLLERLAGEGLSRETLVTLLEHLEQAGLIEEADDHGLSPEELERHAEQIRYLARFTSRGGAQFQARLRSARVAVVNGFADCLSRELARALTDSGVGRVDLLPAEEPVEVSDQAPAARAHAWRARVESDGPGWPDLIVVAQEAHDPDLLEALDEFAKRRRVPWLLVRRVAADEGWVGPLFVPFETASYVSLEARLQANLAHVDDYRALGEYVRASGRPAESGGGLLANGLVLAGIAAAEAVKFLAGFAVPQLAGRFLTVHFGTWTTELHDVLRVPHLERPTNAPPLVFPWQERDAE